MSPTPSPTPTSSPPSPTNTPSSIPAATCIIKPRDESGEEFVTGDRVKIYINDKYIGHYAPETLEFCDSCFCDNDKQVPCGIGSHTIRLEKRGYQNYAQTINLVPGGLETIEPSMTPEDDGGDSSPASTKTPTPKPTATLTKKTTPTPTGSITPTPVPTGEVLGESTAAFFLTSQPTPTATTAGQKTGESRSLPLIFLASSLVFLFTGGVWLWNNQVLKE